MRDERQRSSIYTTAETILEAYADPRVLERSRTSRHRSQTRSSTADATRSTSARPCESSAGCGPLFVALIQSVVQAAYERAAATGRPLDPPLLLVLDEAANIAPLPDLDVLASTGAGQGVQLLTVLQDLAQAHDRWGRDRAETIVNNHRAKVIGAGTSDPRTLEWLSRLLGDEELDQRSSTAGDGRHSETRSVTYRSLAPANVVRQGRPGTAVLVNGNLPPSWIRLRPWFRDRRLRALVQRPSVTRDAARPSRADGRPRAARRARARAGSRRAAGRRAATTRSSTPNSSRYFSTAPAAFCHRSRGRHAVRQQARAARDAPGGRAPRRG